MNRPPPEGSEKDEEDGGSAPARVAVAAAVGSPLCCGLPQAAQKRLPSWSGAAQCEQNGIARHHIEDGGPMTFPHRP